jgi:hypothetical protein
MQTLHQVRARRAGGMMSSSASGGWVARSVGLMVLIALAFVRHARADSCAAMPDCLSCSNSSYACHWCASDNRCHAVGSPYGCLYGVNCYGNDGEWSVNAPSRILSTLTIHTLTGFGPGAMLCFCPYHHDRGGGCWAKE